MENETTHLVSEASEKPQNTASGLPAWMKVGAVAAASAVAGGLAAFWFYRKSLTHLQNSESDPQNSNFRIHRGE
jgi:hypothetical protein